MIVLGGVDRRRLLSAAKRLDHNIAVIAVDGVGLGKLAGEFLRAFELQFGLDDVLHRVILSDPGPHHDPAAGHIEAHFDLQPRRFLHGMAEQFAPLGAEKLHARQRMIAGIAAGADQIHAADPLCFEFFEVAGDALLVDAIEQPPPIDRRFGRGRRVGEARFEVVAVEGDGGGCRGNAFHLAEFLADSLLRPPCPVSTRCGKRKRGNAAANRHHKRGEMR